MKKLFVFLLAAGLLLGAVALVTPKAQAAQSHSDHCYCQGADATPEGHVCEKDAQWVAINSTSGNAVSVVDGGHYYLETNHAISITVKDGKTATLCLNGKTMRAGCPVTVYGDGILNICDCQGSGKIVSTERTKGTVMLISSSQSAVGTVHLYSGTLSGAANNGLFCRTAEVKGGIFYMYGGLLTDGSDDPDNTKDAKPGYGGNVCVYKNGDRSGQFTMYGGVIRGGRSSEYGGNIYGDSNSHIAILGGTVENGSSVRGGNLYCMGDVTLEGATITGGVAELYRGNVYINGTVDLSKNTVTGGMAGGKPEVVRLMRNGVQLVSDHVTLNDAVIKMWKDSAPDTLHLQLSGNVTENRTFTQDIYLDLNGYALTGITVSGKFYGMDSADGTGTLTCTIQGGQLLGMGDYQKVSEGSGKYSFHRVTAEVTHISIVPDKAAMGYKTTLDLPASIMERVTEAGYDMWLEGGAVLSYKKPIDQCGTELTLRLQNILSSGNTQEKNIGNVDTPIHARAFVILEDGSKLGLTEVAYSLHDALEGADDCYNEYSQVQQTALVNLYKTYPYLNKYWHVENFHHTVNASLWSRLTANSLVAMAKNTSGRLVGNYVLTEDVNLGNDTLTLKEGSDLTICLDGHSITGAKQLFSVQGGQLTICDCHEGNNPGTLTSSLSATTGVFAPVAQVINDGVMNLYGGQLKGTNIVRSAGVVAVGHQTKESNATFNLYGGGISGGLADYNGGLVTVWHGSTLNMYGGALYAGQCNGDGGGLVVRDGSRANLYGGKIYNCTSRRNGGGIWVTNQGSCYLGKVKLFGNTATGNGGNLYVDSASVTVDGAAITQGQAGKMGGGVFVNTGAVHTTGTTQIENNTAVVHGDNLHVYYKGQFHADGLQEGAKVRMSCALHGIVGTDPAIADYLRCDDQGYSVQNNGGNMILWNSELLSDSAPTEFSAGYGKACINPKEIDMPLAGYGDTVNRRATEIDGDLYVTATAITDEAGQTVLLMGVDLSGLVEASLEYYLPHISYYTGVPQENIFLNCSHTHSGPSITASDPAIERYKHLLPDLFAQAAILAMNDRQSASMYTGSFDVGGNNGYGLNFTRHYQFLRDGVLEYSCDNFGERTLNNNSAIQNVQHVTQADPTMHLVKFDREGQDILMVNWRAHPTMTGGTGKTVMSSDYVGALREAIEADTGMAAIFFQGAAGNINAVSKLNAEQHGLDHWKYGKALSNQILAAMDGGCLTQQQTGLWQVDTYDYTATVDHSDDDRYGEASAFAAEYYDKFPGNNAPQAERLAWCAERGWTCVFEASSIVRRYGKGETEQMSLSTMALGDGLAFFTAPGELWDRVSMEIEEASPFATTFCLGYCGGSAKYFVYDPVSFPDASGQLTYASYEGFNHNYVFTTINDMVAYWKETLTKLYNS